MRYDPETPFSILIAVERPLLRDAIAAHFKTPEYRLQFVADGDLALRMVKTRKFELIVMGFVLTGLDGLELLKALQAFDPRQPVIMVGDSGHEIEDVYLRCAELLGAAHTFRMPLDPKAFERHARNLMLERRLLAGPRV